MDVVIKGEFLQIKNYKKKCLGDVFIFDSVFCITWTFLMSPDGLAGFALTKSNVLVLPLTRDEAQANVAAYTASVSPSSKLMATSRTEADASGKCH